MVGPLHKLLSGIPLVLHPEESDDEPDLEDGRPTPLGGQLGTQGTHKKLAMPQRTSINALEMAVDTPLDLPVTADERIQSFTTYASLMIPNQCLISASATQAIISNDVASSQHTITTPQDYEGSSSKKLSHQVPRGQSAQTGTP
ncbi:hypothetical protein OPQ81_010704 [Rhizoctonia solani]|nr:hypothetical protein OPQ81_010704 [Rhizoctonia solani]